MTNTVLATITELEKHNDRRISELEGRLNQTPRAHGLINDVEKQNSYSEVYMNEIRTLNQRTKDLFSKLNDLTKSVKIIEKARCVNATINRKYMYTSNLVEAN